MRIRKANEKDFYESLKIAKNLRKWFDNFALNAIPIDFKVNHLVTAVEKNEVMGFLCYSSWEGSMKINWLAVKKEYQGKRIGTSLIGWLENKARKLNSEYLWVETLSYKHKYKAYAKTRDFYYKLGFKKIYDIKAIRKGWNDTILLEKRLDKN